MKIHLSDFSLRQIANSGQCFRMKETSSGIWEVIALNKRLQIQEERGSQNFIFDCSRREFDEFWFNYFDLERDYGKIKENIKMTGDSYPMATVNYGHGLRILQQDLWEIIVTFLISQQNNIPRIKKIVAKLCEPHGCQFPTATMLSKYMEDDFLALRLGYRARYLRNIVKAAVDGDLNLDALKNIDFCDAISFLKRFDGIGDKVANSRFLDFIKWTHSPLIPESDASSTNNTEVISTKPIFLDTRESCSNTCSFIRGHCFLKTSAREQNR